VNDLFSYPKAPGFKALGTSSEAAKVVDNDAAFIRDLVLGALERAGSRGLTADEAADLLRRDKLAVRPRFSELLADGKIMKTEERRKNDSGLRATVWRIACR
jgi:hypothetical protein